MTSYVCITPCIAPYQAEIVAEAESSGLPCTFLGQQDHAQLTDYKVFINPSVSEVCTQTHT